MEKDYSLQLKEIILKEKWMMDILRSVRDLGLPDWYLAAGVVRNTVWDVLHQYTKRTPLNDIDIVYFSSKKNIHDKEVETTLQAKYPKYSFEVVNQAFIHKTYSYKKAVSSSCQAIGAFTETPTCVGIRLEKNNSLTICAPHGLQDLFSLQVMPSSQIPEMLSSYRKRMKQKQWKKTWPKLQIRSIS